MKYKVETYTPSSGRAKELRVLVACVDDPNDMLTNRAGSLHQVLVTKGLDMAIGLYFYRFRNLVNPCAFSKIGEVSGIHGVGNRLKRGWLGTDTYGDTYLGKQLEEDLRSSAASNPLYFTFYEYPVPDSFPKIDELAAFHAHKAYFNIGTRNKERESGHVGLGSSLIFHATAFNEVLSLKFPSGAAYLV